MEIGIELAPHLRRKKNKEAAAAGRRNFIRPAAATSSIFSHHHTLETKQQTKRQFACAVRRAVEKSVFERAVDVRVCSAQ